MRALLYLFLFYPFIAFSQWNTGQEENVFDGKYRFAYVIGNGGDFPFNKPKLSIIRFEDSPPQIELSEIGYSGCSRNTIRIKFNDDEGIINCDNPHANVNKDAIHFPYFENLSKENFFELLKTKNKVYIRFVSSCGLTEYNFSLSGSSSSIDYVLQGYYD
ncbi:hypothetical protein [Pseudozobellia sp. WGM2]|uniref:hypothetical protein n=1 Tax=Pseudozobellia sp. WGM2 TaxID=2787625 RepID=UPI001ADF2FA8|nr:hypothetical protein [Pseudozobellia sp. WGM2]